MSDDKVPAPQVWPTLRARDARALIGFLVEAFGFEETAVYGEGSVVEHAQLTWPGADGAWSGGIMLGSDRDDGGPWRLTPGTCGCYVVCADPDALYARAVAAGAVVVQELNDAGYGSREFAVRDPEGNLWSFGTYRGEPRAV
ncbi:VOC family protein [Dactylosporangium sp. NPDC051485]|uniref:VOC family protein n=1 Tax=Dactylosporangium sp. NPDC051485 TaxID=3154846 RepID=UPI003444741B